MAGIAYGGVEDGNLDTALAELDRFVRQRMADQGGVDSFYDSFVLAAARLARQDPAAAAVRLHARRREVIALADRLRYGTRLQSIRERGAYRYDLPSDRIGYQHIDSDLPTEVMQAAQGVLGCVHYHGEALFKTVYDLALYPMLLTELRPGTVVEIGSGTGASACWLADQLRCLGLTDTLVWSLDIAPPARSYTNVRFQWVDCANPTTIPVRMLAELRRPVLVIEDVHVNVAAVLLTLHPYLAPGDYLYIEDTVLKVADMRRFAEATGDAYAIDTYYTDFFGRNATCAIDGILVRMAV